MNLNQHPLAIILRAVLRHNGGGLLLKKNHITLEFSRGYLMEDPNRILMGKGKYRRHLKLLTKEVILNKEVSSFVKQAV